MCRRGGNSQQPEGGITPPVVLRFHKMPPQSGYGPEPEPATYVLQPTKSPGLFVKKKAFDDKIETAQNHYGTVAIGVNGAFNKALERECTHCSVYGRDS